MDTAAWGPEPGALKTKDGSSDQKTTVTYADFLWPFWISVGLTQFQWSNEVEQLQLRSHRRMKKNKLLFQNLPPTINGDLQRCCCQYRSPSSLRSCRWGHSGTAESHNVCPTPCRAEKHQMVSSLSGHKTKPKVQLLWGFLTFDLRWRSFLVVTQLPHYDRNFKRENMRWISISSPPNCVYACLMSHKAVTNCSQGIGSWYWSKYLKQKYNWLQ